MIGAIAKGIGKGLVKGIGKGLVKGAKFLGRGAKKLWKGLQKAGSKAKNNLLNDASQKKDLGSKNKKFTKNILQENSIEQTRLSKSESAKELAQKFNLSPKERTFLEGIDHGSSEDQDKPKPNPVVHAEDPSIIDTIEVPDYEEIKDSSQDINTKGKITIPSKVSDNLKQHIYAGPPSLKHGYELNDRGIAPLASNDVKVLTRMIEEPLRLQIMAQLNRIYDVTTNIEIAGQHRQLAALNAINDKIENNHYLFLSQNMNSKNLMYNQSKKEDHPKYLDQIIAKYLVSKDGEVALTPDLAEHLQILPQLTDDIAAIQAQVEDLDSKQNKKDKQDAEAQAETLEQNAENSAKLEESTGILNSLNGFVSGILKKLNIMPGIMDIVMIAFLAMDMIKDWWDENFGDLSLEGIASKIWTMLKKVIFTIWDIIKYMWWQYAPDVMGGKPGEFVWNGGDYYYKYKNDKGEVEGYEYNSYDAAGNRVVQQVDKSGKVITTEVGGTTYHSNGTVSSEDGSYTASVGDYGGSMSFNDNSSIFSDKESSKKWTVGSIHAAFYTDSENKKHPVYVLGGSNTTYEKYIKSIEGKDYKPDHSLVFLTFNDQGIPSTFNDPVPGYDHDSKNLANRLFEYIQSGKYDKKYKSSGIDDQSEIDKVKKVTNKVLEEYSTRYRTYTKSEVKRINSEFNQKIEVSKTGDLNTKKAKEFVNSKVYQFDDSGVVSKLGKIAADKAESKYTNKDFYYTQDSKGRMEIYHGGKGADCTSYVTFLLREAGVNLLHYYSTAPTTAIFKGLIEGTDSKTSKLKQDYGMQIISKGKSKPDPSKMQPGDVVIFRAADHGHAAMYLGPGGKYGKYAHMGQTSLNSTFELNDSNYGAYSGGAPFVGAIRFNKSDAYQTKDASEDAMDWVYSPDKAEVPQATGPEGESWNGKQNPKSPNTPGVVESTDFRPGSSNIKLQPRSHNDYRGKGGNVCERSNNPGNIRGTGSKSEVRNKYPGWVGITHSGSGDFSTFENQMWGIYAFYRLLATQYLPKGQNTIRSIFYKYCPPGDHGQNAPTGYIRHVSKQSGLGENEVIKKPEKNLFQTLMKSVYQYEGGTKRAPMAQEDLDEAWDIFNNHFKDQSWPVVATREPEHYGTNPDGSINASNEGGSTEPNLKSVLGQMLKDAPTSSELVASTVGSSHPDIVAEVDPNAKPLEGSGKVDLKSPKKGKELDQLAASQQPGNVVINNHNYPANKQDYKINPDSFLHRQLNDA